MDFSYLRKIQARKLYLPLLATRQLGFDDNCQLYLCLDQPSGLKNVANEILISNIPVEQRKDLWVLDAAFIDRKGIIAEISTKLADFGIDIVNLDVHTVEGGRFLNVKMLLNCFYYDSQIDGNYEQRIHERRKKLPFLETYIASEFIGDILFNYDQLPILFLEKNSVLSRSANKSLFRYKPKLRKRCIVIAKNILDKVKESYSHHYPKVGSTPYAYLHIDQYGYILRAYILYANTGHVCCRITLSDEIGVLQDLASLFNDRDFNILHISGIDGIDSKITFEILAHLECDKHRDADRNDLNINNMISAMIDDELNGAKVTIYEL